MIILGIISAIVACLTFFIVRLPLNEERVETLLNGLFCLSSFMVLQIMILFISKKSYEARTKFLQNQYNKITQKHIDQQRK